MNEVVAAGLLGMIQGLTEFLPVSSSGHLVLFQSFLPVVGDPVAFDLALHMGTLVPVVVVYGKDLAGIVRDIVAGQGRAWDRPGVRLLALLVIGSLPTAVIGLAFEDLFESLFSNPLSVALAFAVTGVVLYGTRFMPQGSRDEGRDGKGGMAPWHAAVVGTVQGLAITPGISRSGSTIATGLLLGMSREYAARFSFLLSLPAILGAFLLRSRHLHVTGDSALPLAVGFLSSAVVGYFALRILLRLVRAGDFSKFSWYLWFIAVVALVVALL